MPLLGDILVALVDIPTSPNTENIGLNTTTKGIRIASWNVNRISNKKDEIKAMLSTDPRPVDIIGISETFLSPLDDGKDLNVSG